MNDLVTLKAEVRTQTGKTVEKVRKAGLVPAVLYGHKVKNLLLSVDKKDMQKVFSSAGESTLIKLDVVSDKPHTVLIHDVQRHYLENDLTHVDFYEVDMKEKIKAAVALEFSGEAKAVKDLGGVLVKNLNEVEVESLPGDLPHSILVDISKLNTFQDTITVADLPVDLTKVKILASPGEVVAKVEAPRSEEELKALEEKPTIVEPTAVEGVVKETPEASAEEKPAKTEKIEKEKGSEK
jgi:large subunit ribosomal protein L25